MSDHKLELHRPHEQSGGGPACGHLMSESEEMYLNTIARLGEAGVVGPIPLAQLADALQVQPVSVNQMVRKLATAGWVTYLPYKGVELTHAGRGIANEVLRARRLWQVFLVDHLQLDAATADALACRLEHVTPTQVADSLADYLQNPAMNPSGKPIPASMGEEATPSSGETHAVGDLAPGEEAVVVRVDAIPPVAQFLTSQGIVPRAVVRLLAGGVNGVLLQSPGGAIVTLAGDVADAVVIVRRPAWDAHPSPASRATVAPIHTVAPTHVVKEAVTEVVKEVVTEEMCA